MLAATKFQNFGSKRPSIVTTGTTTITKSEFVDNQPPQGDFSNAPLIYTQGTGAAVALRNMTSAMNGARQDLGQPINSTEIVRIQNFLRI